jgi:hypothetical protein
MMYTDVVPPYYCLYIEKSQIEKSYILIMYRHQEQSLRWCCKISFATVTGFYDLFECIYGEGAPSYPEHGGYQAAYHSPEKTVGFDMIYKCIPFFVPYRMLDIADKGLYLGISFGERGKVAVFP